jgi:hypothetical protein
MYRVRIYNGCALAWLFCNGTLVHGLNDMAERTGESEEEITAPSQPHD